MNMSLEILSKSLTRFRLNLKRLLKDIEWIFGSLISADIREEPQGASSRWHSQAVIIECDGHAFHEKTPNQAQRDKERDRNLQKLGYKVFHYTGREIWQDVFKCAHEAVKSIQESGVYCLPYANVHGEPFLTPSDG
jgi:Protein of unknown function (DUF559)